MSPQNLCSGQRFNCHFLEADLCHDFNHNEPANDVNANADHPLLQPSSGAGGTIAAAPGGGICGNGASGGFGVSRTCGLKFAAVPAELSAVIPPMKRRLITLSTAGNLKISPLCTQQLHHHRIYPVRRPSQDGAAAAVMAAAAPAEAREATSQQSQPPPPPSTPARQPHTPSSHLEGIRRELSPREDNVLQGVFHLAPSSPEPSQPYTPRPTSPGISSGGGAAATAAGVTTTGGACTPASMFSTPYLILRPVRSVHERSGEGCCPPTVVVSAGGALYSEAPAPVRCARHVGTVAAPRLSTTEVADVDHDVKVTAMGASAVSTGVTATAAMAGPALGLSIAISSECHLGGQNWFATPLVHPLFTQQAEKDEKDNQQQQMAMSEQHPQHAQEQQEAQPPDQSRQKFHDRPHSLRAESFRAVDLPASAKSAADVPENGCGGSEGATALVSGSNNAAYNVNGGDVAADNAAPEPLVDPGNVAAADAATAAAPAANGGLSWTSIEVTVAVRPKAGLVARHPGVRVGLGSPVPEFQNGYVQGPACGVFDLTRYLTGRDCVKHFGRWVSRSQFEKAGGSTMAKWYRSIRVLPDLEPLGEWLERHDMPVLRGPARRSRKRPAEDSGDEMDAFETTVDRNAAPRNDGAAAVAITTAEATAEGDWDATVRETWANCMPLQDRNGGGGSDDAHLVQRLLGTTWPFRQTVGIAPAAAEPLPPAAAPPAAESAAAGGFHSQHASLADPYRDPTQAEQASLIPHAVATIAALGAVNPIPVNAAAAVQDCARTVQGPPAWGMAANETGAPGVDGKGAATSSKPLLALPVLRARVSSLQLSSPPRSPRAPDYQLPTETARKLPTEFLEQSRALLQGRQFQKEGGMSGVLAGVLPPPPLPPPLKRARTGEPWLGAPVRPRLLLHRTSVSEGYDPEHPYLFAVQAPPGMLYRQGKASGDVPSTGVASEDAHITEDQKLCAVHGE